MTSPAPLVQVVTLDTLHGQMGMPCTTLLFLEDAHVLEARKDATDALHEDVETRAMRARSIMFSRYVRVSIVSRFLALMSRRTWVFARRAERSRFAAARSSRSFTDDAEGTHTHQQQHPRCFPAHQQHAREPQETHPAQSRHTEALPMLRPGHGLDHGCEGRKSRGRITAIDHAIRIAVLGASHARSHDRRETDRI